MLVRKCVFLFVMAGMTAFGQKVEESLSVVLRDVRVHVVDRDGFPVRNLTRDDFILKENKTGQELSFFEEVDLIEEPVEVDPDAEISPALRAQKGRAILIFIDSSLMMPNAFDPMIESVEEFITQEVGPLDLAKIVQMERNLIHLTPFTSDKALLRRGLRDARYKGYMFNRLRTMERRLVNAYDAFRFADATPGSGDERAGRKQQLADDTFYALDEKERAKTSHYRTFFLNQMVLAKIMQPIPGTKVIFNFSGGGHLVKLGRFSRTMRYADKLAETFNHANITMHTFLNTGKDSITAAVSAAADNRLNSDWEIWGELTQWASAQNARRRYKPNSDDSTFLENNIQIETAPRHTAEATGGFFKREFAIKGMVASFKAFKESTKHYYRLAYSVEPGKKVNKLEVQLKNPQPGWTLTYGNRFRSPPPFEKWDETDRQISFEATLILGGDSRNDLNVSFGQERFLGSQGSYVTPVFCKLSLPKIPKNGLQVGFAALSQNRNILDLTQATLESIKETENLLFYNVLFADEAPAFLRTYVRDLDSGEYSEHEAVLPAWPKKINDGLRIGDLVLCNPDENKVVLLNHINQDPEYTEEVRRREQDPMAVGSLFVKPNIGPLPKGTDKLNLFFHLQGAKAAIDRYQVQFFLQKGKENRQVEGKIEDLFRVNESTYKARVSVETGPLEPAFYRVIARVLETAPDGSSGNKAALGQRIFEIQ